MFLKRFCILFSFIGLATLSGKGQSSFEVIPSLGTSFAVSNNYDRSTGHFNAAFLPSLSLIYHPTPVVGIELSYLNQTPVTFLVY